MVKDNALEYAVQPPWLRQRYEAFALSLLEKGYPIDPELTYLQIAESMFKGDLTKYNGDIERLREKLTPIYIEAE